MKRIIGLVIVFVLLVMFSRGAFATEILNDDTTLEAVTTIVEETESSVSELETTVEEATTVEDATTEELTTLPVEEDIVTTLEPVEPIEPEDEIKDDVGKIEAIKNTLTTLLEQSEKARTVYYIINTLCTLISVLMLVLIGKKNKKHNSEITKEVCNQVAILYNKQITDSITVIEESVKPVFDQLSKSQEAVVKAVALLHLKDDGAAIASLDCLSDVLSTDAKATVENIKIVLKKHLDEQEANRDKLQKDLINLVDRAEKEITGGRTFIQDLSKRIL